MRVLDTVGIEDIRAVYSGPEGALWELLMGSQIHMGGLKSSMELSQRAGIRAGSCGVDLCCHKGAGMRFLARFREVAHMTGVDATMPVIIEGQRQARQAGFADRIRFVHAEASDTGLDHGSFDFVWGEDAWCYVADKPALIQEAVGLVGPGGTIAFTDWIEGATPLSSDEARRFMTFMKFPSLATAGDYRRLLEQNGCRVESGEDTGRFAPSVALYTAVLEQQLTYDALAIIGFDRTLLEAIGGEMAFIDRLAREGKLAQGLFVATRID